MNDLEDRLLAHIGLYQISFAQVIEARFLDGQSCGRLMNQLASQDRVQIRKGFPGQTPKYYQLTRRELKRRGLPEGRSKRPKSQAFPTAISILWFCNMLGTVRHLLEPAAIEQLFPTGLPGGTHCVEKNSEGHRIFRLRATSPGIDADSSCLLKSLRKRVSQAFTFPGLRPWVSSGRYAFAVLTESKEQAEQIRQMIAVDDLLSSLGAVVVEITPGLATLAREVESRKSPRSLEAS